MGKKHSVPNRNGTDDPVTVVDSNTPTERSSKLKKPRERLTELYTSPSKKRVQLRLSQSRSAMKFVNLTIVKRPPDKKKRGVSSFHEETTEGIDKYCSRESQEEIAYYNTLACSSEDSGKRVILIGSPGIGKTTLARNLCRDLCTQQISNKYELVLFFELRKLKFELNRSKCKIGLPFLLKCLGLPEDLSAVIEEQDGKDIALILDGYDEISDDTNVSTWIKDLISKESLYMNECDMFVTSRPSQVSELTNHLEDLTVAEIVGFTNKNMNSYITNYPFETKHRAEEVIQKLNHLPLVRGMCSNPRILEIMCMLHQHESEEPPETQSDAFVRLVCHELEEDLSQRQPPVRKRRISNLLDVPKDLFPGFYQLCEVAYQSIAEPSLKVSRDDSWWNRAGISYTDTQGRLCFGNRQCLVFTDEDLGALIQYKDNRGSIYNLLFSEEVESLSPVDRILYQCDHKTVQETLAAVHIGHLNHDEQKKIWKRLFDAEHMVQVWNLYCKITELKFVDIKAFQDLPTKVTNLELGYFTYEMNTYEKRLLLSLYESGNRDLTGQVLSDVFGNSLHTTANNQYEVAVIAHAISCHPHLESMGLTSNTESWKLLKDCLKRVKSIGLFDPPIETVVHVLSNDQARPQHLRLFLKDDNNEPSSDYLKSLADAVKFSGHLQSLHFHLEINCESGWSDVVESSSGNKNITSISVHHSALLTSTSEPHLLRLDFPLDCLKTVFEHHESVTLKLWMSTPEWKFVLSGLKEAQSLSKLSLDWPSGGRIIKRPVAVVLMRMRDGVPLNGGDETFYEVDDFEHPEAISLSDLEDVIATLPQLMTVDVSCVNADHNLLKLPIMKGALKNKKVTHLSVDICNDTELLEVLNELEREPSPGHLTNITLTARFHDHVNFDNFREMEIRGCAQLCSCLKLQPICILSLGLMIEDCRLLLSNLCFALCLEELYLTENDAGINNCSSKSDSCSSTKNDEVKMSLAQCKLKILRMQHNCYGWDFDDIPLTSPKWSTLYGAVLEGLASNHCQVDFIDFTLFGENLNISAIQSTLQPEVIRKFDFNEYYCDWCSVMIIFFCQPVPNDNPAQEMPDPPIAAPRCFNSRVFMKKYSSFPVEVKAKSIALKLRNNEAISAALLHNIDQTYEEEAGQLLYKELLGRGTPSQIRTVCEAMRDEEGNPQMNQLGRDMLDDEDLPPESIGAC